MKLETSVRVEMPNGGAFRADGDLDIAVQDGHLTVFDLDRRELGSGPEVFIAAPGAWLWARAAPMRKHPSAADLASRLSAYDTARAAFNPT